MRIITIILPVYNDWSNLFQILKKIEKINAPAGYLDGPADIHSIKNNNEEPVTTLHVYAKPYDICDIYDLKTNQIQRKKMNYYSIDGIIS